VRSNPPLRLYEFLSKQLTGGFLSKYPCSVQLANPHTSAPSCTSGRPPNAPSTQLPRPQPLSRQRRQSPRLPIKPNAKPVSSCVDLLHAASTNARLQQCPPPSAPARRPGPPGRAPPRAPPARRPPPPPHARACDKHSNGTTFGTGRGRRGHRTCAGGVVTRAHTRQHTAAAARVRTSRTRRNSIHELQAEVQHRIHFSS
jgi:hypothetical protein